MSISNVSNAAAATPASASSATLSNPLSLWTQIGGALKSGNLAGAQQAFSSLKSNYEQSHTSGTKPSGGPLASDVVALARALNSGSLSDAQAAFSTLKQAASAAGIDSHNPSTTVTTPPSSTSANSVDVLA
jgi:hypothetical protein